MFKLLWDWLANKRGEEPRPPPRNEKPPSSPTYFPKPSPSFPEYRPAYYFSPPKPSTPTPAPTTYSSKPSPPKSYASAASSSSNTINQPPPPVYKSFLSPASSSNTSNQHQQDGKKTAYICVEEDSLPAFLIPEDIQALIKKDIVPKILNRPLSPTTYKDYFAALLYSEDFYLEVH